MVPAGRGRAALAAVLLVASVGCASTASDQGSDDAGAAATTEGPVWSDVLTIEDRRYHPDDLLGGAGRELWVENLDAEAHTVTSFDGSFDVEVGPGERVEILLPPEPGAYPYACRFHPEMGAEIDVM
jgi:plastocyanin